MGIAPEIAAHLAYLALRGLSSRTITERRRFLVRLTRILPVPLLLATPEDLLAWRASLRVTRAVVGHYVSHARQFYEWAAAEGLAACNPAAGLPVPKRPRRLPRPISEDDLMAVLAAAPERIRLWLVLAGWTGMRACEIAYLRCENIRLGPVPCILIVADATKGLSERTIPLCPFAAAELAAAGLPRRGWAFLRYDGKPGPNTPGVVSKLACRHLHECGLPDTLHQLRHRMLTMSYRATHDLRLVQELAGHADPATTAVYTAYDNAEAIAAVAALPVPRLAAGLSDAA
jgi:integrase/recombinase XerC